MAVVPSNFPEDLDPRQYSPEGYVEENARQKCLETRVTFVFFDFCFQYMSVQLGISLSRGVSAQT